MKRDWQKIRLKEIGSVCMCKRILKHQTNTEKGIPFYKIGTFGKKADAFISEELYKKYKNKYNYPENGDILISAAGTLGETVVYDGKPAYFQDSNIVWLKHDNTKAINKFLFYVYAMKPWKVPESSTIPRLYNDNILNTYILLPPLPEQEKIAEILGTWDSTIEKLTALIAAKRLQKKGLMQKLLTARIRLPSFTGEWASFEFKNISFLIKEKYSPISSEHYKCVELEHIDPHSARLLGYVDSSEQHSVKNKFYKKDIIFGKLRPYLKKFYKVTFNGVCSTEFWVLRGKNGTCLTDFLYWLIQMPEFNAVCNVSSGTHMPRADWSYVSEIPFSIPTDISEQKAIADILSKADEEIDLLTRKLDLLQSQKKGLMQQLLTGKIRVKVA